MLRLSQVKYVGRVLDMFTMDKAKLVNRPLGSHFRHSGDQLLKSKKERGYMNKVLYVSTIGSLYAMICTRPDITYVVRVASMYMSNQESSIVRQ